MSSLTANFFGLLGYLEHEEPGIPMNVRFVVDALYFNLQQINRGFRSRFLKRMCLNIVLCDTLLRMSGILTRKQTENNKQRK